MTGPSALSLAAIDKYSIEYAIYLALSGSGWQIPASSISHDTDLWPSGEEIIPPAIYVMFSDNATHAWELGANGMRHNVQAHIYATNDSERDALAEEITNVFRDTIPIYDWETGNEDSPAVVDRFNTEGDVTWRHIPATASMPNVERWRAVVQAVLSRQEA